MLKSPLPAKAGRGKVRGRTTRLKSSGLRMRGIRIPEVKRARALRRLATSAERKIWAGLRNRSLGRYKFVRQEPIGPYYADFVCREAHLIVEIDGATHSSEHELAYDKMREDFLRADGYRILRFTNTDVYEQSEAVFDAILATLEKMCGK
jgi:very-short-patch-repair endonuclease